MSTRSNHPSLDAAALLATLLPQPRAAQPRAGSFAVPDPLVIAAPTDLAAPERAALDRCAAALGARVVRDVAGAQLTLRRAPELADATGQRYRLRIAPAGVELAAATDVGLFYGLQTLAQIVRVAGRTWPAVELDDAPDFATRGVSYDVSRGKVPTLATLKLLVDRLAALKVNHLQLYVEHTFAFAFDPAISAGCTPLTPDEIRALDAHCAARRVQLVPSLASFGHMARILSLPQYRDLAEVDAERPFEEMTWRQRVRGLTLDVSNPAARALLERMYAEYLPCFSAPALNVCCDETFDLARGRGRARADEIGVGRLYLEHLRWLHGLCGRHGKRMLFWGDMLKKYPELLPDVPRDAVVLNWAYAADADYDSTAAFRAAGLETWVCPGTSAWNRFVPEINVADLNIRRHTAAGLRHGATGVLNTDWGDDGHVAPPAGAWPALALGAAVAWNTAAPDRETFDAACARLYFGGGGAVAIAAWRRALEAGAMDRVWPACYAPLATVEAPERFDDAALATWVQRADEAAAAWQAVQPCDAEAAADRDELVLAFELHALTGRRLRLGRRLATGPAADLRRELRDLAATCEHLVPRHEAIWLARHKSSYLHEISAALHRLAGEARAAAD